jgi:hypothetical protein
MAEYRAVSAATSLRSGLLFNMLVGVDYCKGPDRGKQNQGSPSSPKYAKVWTHRVSENCSKTQNVAVNGFSFQAVDAGGGIYTNRRETATNTPQRRRFGNSTQHVTELLE